MRLKTGKGKYYTFKGRQRGIRGAGKTQQTRHKDANSIWKGLENETKTNLHGRTPGRGGDIDERFTVD